jgi:hypothetical protein
VDLVDHAKSGGGTHSKFSWMRPRASPRAPLAGYRRVHNRREPRKEGVAVRCVPSMGPVKACVHPWRTARKSRILHFRGVSGRRRRHHGHRTPGRRPRRILHTRFPSVDFGFRCLTVDAREFLGDPYDTPPAHRRAAPRFPGPSDGSPPLDYLARSPSAGGPPHTRLLSELDRPSCGRYSECEPSLCARERFSPSLCASMR